MSKAPRESEATIQARIRQALFMAGWTATEKTHGNRFQHGWPDLYCFHPSRGHRWVEVKAPDGSLTKAQIQRFSMWTGAGIDVHVLCNTDFILLQRPGNWTEWLSVKQKAQFEARKALLCPNGPTMTRLEDWG